MNIVTCEECSALLDGDILFFNHNAELPDGTLNTDKLIWHDRDYHIAAPCPVCKELVMGGIHGS